MSAVAMKSEALIVLGLSIIVGVLVVWQKLILLALISVGILMYLAIKKTIWILYLTILITPFTGIITELIPKKYFFERTLVISDILFMFLIIGLVFHFITARQNQWTSKLKVDKSVIFLSLIILYGFLYGVLNQYDAFFRESRGLLFYTTLPLLIVFMRNYVNEKTKETFLNFLYFYFIFVCIMAILFSLGFLDFFVVASRTPGQIMGFLRPNQYIDTIISIPAIFSGILGVQYGEYKRDKILSIICVVLGTTVLMISVTRGFLLGFILSFVVFSIILKRGGILSFRTLATALVLLMSLYIVTNFFRFDFIEAYTGRFQESRNVENRIEEAKDYFNSFKQKPLVGHGFGSPVVRSLAYGGETTYSHNEYLYFLQTVGVIGFSIFSWFIVKLIIASSHVFKNTRNKYDTIISSLTLMTVLSFIIISVSSPEFRNITTTPFLIILISFVYSSKADINA